MGEPKLDQLIDKKTLAEYLGVKGQWIEAAIKNQGFPAYKIGKHLRFKVAEVNLWLKERRVNG